eukprot:24403_1
MAVQSVACEQKLDQECINCLRGLAIDMVSQAKSGHPGMPLGMAPAAHVLFSRVMRFSPTHADWPARDRFVLSNGHGCALVYSMLHLCGYRISMDELKNFRQLGSITPGHPENVDTEGIEVTTGPLGQGLSNAVGMAIAQAQTAATYNRPGHQIVDGTIFVFCGDGCLQEGITSEAASLAGHLQLKDLVVVYDDNRITIDGSTALSFSEDVPARFRAYGWHTLTVNSGDSDLEAIEAALREAKRSDRPTLISLKTTIGYGSPVADTAAAHGAPLKDDQLRATKQSLGLNPDEFFAVPERVREFYKRVHDCGDALAAEWRASFGAYGQAFPAEAAQFRRIFDHRRLAEGWDAKMPKYTPDMAAEATRSVGGKVLNAIAEYLPEMVGGSADLTPSNKTQLKCSFDFASGKEAGRYIRFGVREHAMFAIGNGISAYGMIPYTATFLNFLTYGWGAVRLAALSKFRHIFYMTHDSIGLGEDGPTHQPIEVLPLIRATPNLGLFRPADGAETVGAFRAFLPRADRPVVLCLSRQNLPQLEGSSEEGVAKGAYILRQTCQGEPDVVLIASGSEVSLAVDSAKELEQSSISVRVVSCPSSDLFLEQPLAYRRAVLTERAPVISVEAASVAGWAAMSHFQIGMRSFGKSAKAKDLLSHFGFTPENVVAQTKKFLTDLQTRASELDLPPRGVLGVLQCLRE